MPPKTVITREMIEEAAFDIMRKEGVEAVTARRIAQELNCSTQPVYTACGSMTSVKSELERRGRDFVERFLQTPSPGAPPFLRMGLANLRLARQEPHLFALASLHIRERDGQPPPEAAIAAMREDPRMAGMPVRQLARVHSLIWFFCQGLATLVGPGSPDDAMAKAEQYLREAGEAVIEFEARRGSA